MRNVGGYDVQTDQHALTEGDVWKKLLLFALPILLGNIFQQLYNTADALIVGRFMDKAALGCRYVIRQFDFYAGGLFQRHTWVLVWSSRSFTAPRTSVEFV